MIIRGTVAVLGDFIPADSVLPARHSFAPPGEMAAHVLEELGPGVNARVRAHPILVAGELMGYGTGRESPARALRAAGVRALLCVSFARMFFRNAVNNGILPVECPALVRAGPGDGEPVEIDLEASVVRWNGREFPVARTPAVLRDIIAAGDLVSYGRSILAGGR